MIHHRTPFSETEADLHRYLNRLGAKADDLFVPQDEEEIQAIFFPKDQQPLSTDGTLDVDALLSKIKCTDSPFILCLAQHHSFSPLGISQSSLLKLMIKLRVHEKFLDNVCAFGAKKDHVEENFSRLYSSGTGADGQSAILPVDFAMTYILKYVASKTKCPREPFVLRQLAVYHGMYGTTDTTNTIPFWILLGHIDDLLHLETYVVASNLFPEWNKTLNMNVHSSILTELSSQLRPYLKCLEERFLGLKRKSNACGPTEPPRPGTTYLDYQDVNRLHNLDDTLLRLRESSEINKAAVEMWKKLAKGTASHLECQAFDTTSADIDDRLRQIETNILRITFLSKRVEGVMSKITVVLNMRESYLSQQIAERTCKHNGYMSESMAQTSPETRMIMLLSVMSVLCQPATLAAAIFDSSFFDFQNGSLIVAQNVWIYPVFAAGLTIAGILMFRCWTRWYGASSRGKKNLKNSIAEC